MKLKILIVSTFSAFFTPLNTTPSPQLSRESTIKKAKEIVSHHYKYQHLSNKLCENTLKNFMSLLDPWKTYLLKNEVGAVLPSTKKETQQITNQLLNADFSAFNRAYAIFLKSVQRQKQLQALYSALTYTPKNTLQLIQPNFLKKAPATTLAAFKEVLDEWPSSLEQLNEKLRSINKKRLEATKSLSEADRELYFKRLDKHKQNKEEQLLHASADQTQKNIYSLFLKALCQSLDSHTTYFTPQEARSFLMQIQQKLCGIGASLRDDLDGFTIVEIIEGGPCSKLNELQPGDKIIEVNNHNVVGLEIQEVVEQIRGKKGSDVQLTLLQGPELKKKNLSITRDEIILQEARCSHESIKSQDKHIAYLKLHSFYQDEKSSSAQDLYDAFKEISSKDPVDGVVLDLRFNTGGFITQAIEVSSLFMKYGVVTSIKDNEQNVYHLRNLENKQMWKGPLVVLINPSSASASEIVAQCLQDYGVGIIVGDTTSFGKGTYQHPTQDISGAYINPEGEYKVTRGMYYTASGRSPQCKGVFADVVVPGPLADAEMGEKYTANPLPNDKIQPMYKDNLSDLPFLHKIRLKSMYDKNRQLKTNMWTKHLKMLKNNSSKRIASNDEYQKFQKECSSPHGDLTPFKDKDFQKEETINVLVDIINQ